MSRSATRQADLQLRQGVLELREALLASVEAWQYGRGCRGHATRHAMRVATTRSFSVPRKYAPL